MDVTNITREAYGAGILEFNPYLALPKNASVAQKSFSLTYQNGGKIKNYVGYANQTITLSAPKRNT